MTFDRIKKLIKQRLGKVEGDDVYYVELLLDAWKIYYESQRHIEQLGIIVQTNQRAYINPAINSKNESHKQIVSLNKLLGITPRNRDAGDDDEDFGDLLGG